MWGQRAGLGALVQEDVKRMLIKAHYGRHYVIIDHGDHTVVHGLKCSFGNEPFI